MLRRASDYRVPIFRVLEYAWRLAIILVCLVAIRYMQLMATEHDRLTQAVIQQGAAIHASIDLQAGDIAATLSKINTTEQTAISRMDSNFAHVRVESSAQAKTAVQSAKQESKAIQATLTDTSTEQTEAITKMADKVEAATGDAPPAAVVVNPAPVTVLPAPVLPAPSVQAPTDTDKPKKRGRWGKFWRAITFREP